MAQSKYETHVKQRLFEVECWARDGIIDEDIAKKLGISKDTFYKYIKIYPDFSDSLKKGKEVIDYEVENALLKRALGYEIEEVKTYIEDSENGKQKKRIEKTKKHIVPNVIAAIFWLRNRRKDKWSNNPETSQVDEQTEDDEFIEALNASTKEVWNDERDNKEDEEGSV